jgi:hypothetical protein
MPILSPHINSGRSTSRFYFHSFHFSILNLLTATYIQGTASDNWQLAHCLLIPSATQRRTSSELWSQLWGESAYSWTRHVGNVYQSPCRTLHDPRHLPLPSDTHDREHWTGLYLRRRGKTLISLFGTYSVILTNNPRDFQGNGHWSYQLASTNQQRPCPPTPPPKPCPLLHHPSSNGAGLEQP